MHFNIYLDDGTGEQLNKAAERAGESRNALTRRAVGEWLKRSGRPQWPDEVLSFQGMPDFRGSLLALFDPAYLGFAVAYLAVGGVFAGLIYAVSVVSIPMVLDRGSDAISAGLASLQLVFGQPGVMLCWGALITALVVLAMLPGFAGLLVGLRT